MIHLQRQALVLVLTCGVIAGCTVPPVLDRIMTRPKEQPSQTSTGTADQQNRQAVDNAKPETKSTTVARIEAPEAALAQKYVAAILTANGDVRSQLIASLIAADFPVLDEKAKPIVLNGKRGVGIPIRTWEVAALLDMAKSNWVMPMWSLETILKTTPDFEGVPWGNILLEGIRGAATDKDESARFWAHLVTEFGKAQVGQDLLDGSLTADRVMLIACNTN